MKYTSLWTTNLCTFSFLGAMVPLIFAPLKNGHGHKCDRVDAFTAKHRGRGGENDHILRTH